MPEPVKGNTRYIPALDGLRALAVLAVVAYHLQVGWAPGGLLGVNLFFVLSGYLITDLLVTEWQDNGRIELKNFWLRRARRLLPALCVMLVVVMDWVTLSDHAQLAAVRLDVVAAMAYVCNWWFIFHHVSYFASFGPPSPLGHLWSLAVEEQFYLVWPLLLLCGLRYIPRRGVLIGLVLAGAAASALAMAVLFHPGSDPNRVYYGTDTRAFALLIGAALALVWPGQKLSGQVSPRALLGIDLAGCACLLTVLAMMWQTNQYETFLYRGGLLLVSAAAAVLVAALAHPASRLGKAFGWEPLRWLGVRSYGIYLWQYPVIVLTSPVMNAGGFNIMRAALQVAASIALAALSWRFVEEPIRRGALQKLWALLQRRALPQSAAQGRAGGSPAWGGFEQPREVLETLDAVVAAGADALSAREPGPDAEQVAPRPRRHLFLKTWAVSAAAGCALVVFCLGMANVVPGTVAGPGSAIASTIPAASASVPIPGPVQASAGSFTAVPAAGDAGIASAGLTTASPDAAVTGHGVTAIGDSVLVDAAPDLDNLLPGIIIDASVGRQLIDTQEVVNRLQAGGQLGSRVIIELGTNGPFTEEQLESLLDSLGSVQQVVLVNARVPRPWESVVNDTLAQVASARPDVTLVDWYAASAGDGSFFYSDGVHLAPAGSQAYAALVAKAVQPASQ